MSERTPQDVLRELRREIETVTPEPAYKDDSRGQGWFWSGHEVMRREALEALDKAIAAAPDSPPIRGRWTTERRPEDDAECERLGCEDRTHPVHHWAPDTLSEKPGLDVDLAAMRNVEEMLDTYLGAEEAARASNDVVAELRLAGFVISRSASTDSEGR